MRITITRCALCIIVDAPAGGNSTGASDDVERSTQRLLDRLAAAMRRAGVADLTRQLPCRLIAGPLSGSVATLAERAQRWLVTAGCEVQLVDW